MLDLPFLGGTRPEDAAWPLPVAAPPGLLRQLRTRGAGPVAIHARTLSTFLPHLAPALLR